MGLNLGNFGGQLTADELRRALAATGGNPNDLDFGEPSLPAAAEPAFTPPPSAVPPPVEEPPPPEPPPDMSVRRASGGPQRAIKQYQDENLADANKRIEIAGRSGDAAGMDAQAYEEQAAVRGRQAEQSRAGIAEAKSRVDERRAHEQRYQQEADRLYEDMRAHAQPPPQSTVSKVLGIVGAVAGMGGKGSVASGLGMLSSMLGSDQDRWAQEQAANSQLYRAALQSVGSDREGMSSDLDVAQRMAVLEAHEIDASLEQVKAMGLSRNASRTAENLQLKFRSEVRDGLIAMEAQKAKAAAASGNAAQRDFLMRASIPELRRMLENHQLSEVGQEILAEKIKKDQADLGGYVKINKDMAEGGEGGVQKGVGGGAVIEGLELRKPARDVTASDYNEAQKIKDGVVALESALTAMEKTQGSFDTDDKAEYERNFAMAVGGLNTLANAGVLNPGELKAWEERLPAHVISNTFTMNPAKKIKAWAGDEEKQISGLRKQLKGIASEKLKSRGYDFGGSREGGDATAARNSRLGFTKPSAAAAPAREAQAPGADLPPGPGAAPRRQSPQELAEEYLARRGMSGAGGGF